MEKDFFEILVLNPNLETIKNIDTLKSLIWTDRYYGAGDFEIYTPVNLELMSFLQQDYYLWRKGSEHLMMIESMKIKCDIEEGDHLIVTGRSLEFILDRRIVWEQTILTGNFQDAIQTLLNENVISPAIEDRKISNFIFEPSTDPNILSLTVDAQIERGTNLYEAVLVLCFERGVGFKITLSDDKFIFKLYKGEDRSYDQFDNPYVVFSSNFENLMNSNYIETKTNLKTVTLIDGEEESTVVGGESGLTRREIYTDAKSIYRTVDGVTLTDEEYLAQLEQRGSEVLSEHSFSTSFDGELDSATTYKYGEDFFLGDLVQIINEYGIEAKTRVIEMIYSQDLSGLKEYPTFATDEVQQSVSNGVLTPTPGGSGGSVDITGPEIIAKIVTSGVASVTAANWYRIARLTGPTGRGDGIVSIYTTGGSYTPYTAVIKYHKTWSNFGGLIVEAMTNVGYWSGVRITQDAVNTSLFYLEVYITRALQFTISTMPSLGYPSPPEILTGNLQVGGGTVITSIPTLKVGVNATV